MNTDLHDDVKTLELNARRYEKLKRLLPFLIPAAPGSEKHPCVNLDFGQHLDNIIDRHPEMHIPILQDNDLEHWRSALICHLVQVGAYRMEHEASPAQAIQDLIAKHVQIATQESKASALATESELIGPPQQAKHYKSRSPQN